MYEIQDHTADEKFRAVGETLEEAFSEAVKAFGDIVKADRGEIRHSFKIESENLEALLFDFLDQLIFLQDTEGVAVSEAQEINIQDLKDSYVLEATVLVSKITPGKNYTDIKAPTYNEMKVDVENGNWILEAVLDI